MSRQFNVVLVGVGAVEDWNKGVIANSNCTTAIMLEAVAPLHKAKTLKRLIASTC